MSSEPSQHLEALLQPIHDNDLCGPSLRYDAIYTEIRMAREEDDPTLPMRQWERPLKKADWTHIDSLCQNALIKQTKDLQLAVWLTEARMRLQGLTGLRDGLSLMFDLSYRFWDNIHPLIEDGDSEARVAPFDWLSESISLSLKVHVVMFTVFERLPSRITLAEWDKLTSEEISQQDPLQQQAEEKKIVEYDVEPINRAELLSMTRQPANVGALREQLEAARDSHKIVSELKAFLDEKLGMDAPNMNKLLSTLSAFERVLDLMTLTSKTTNQPAHTQAKHGAASGDSVEGVNVMSDEKDLSEEGTFVHISQWRTREEAYATLEAVAAYLQQREPHSPTPYLIKKAVRWGRLPLPELMQEIMREDGDLNRLTSLFKSSQP